ncbi:MAG: hypothetical protein IKP42_03135 [Ruminococcus sp.]|nr:hypothetical protein [Ruminococcus sp.]
MKKQNNNLPIPSKWRKRTAAVVTAAVMVFTNTPINPLYEKMNDWLSSISITAKAADDWVIDTHIYPINSASDLSRYSVAYHEYPTNHAHDTLEINFTGETASLEDYTITPFYSIGETEPFRGTITVNDNSLNYINIDKAFFDQIGEEAVIKADSSGSNAIIISRSAVSTDPIFAKKVVAAESDAATSGADLGWSVNTKTYLDNGNPVSSNVDSLIGEIEDGCKVKVSFTDERCMNVVSSENVGYICGTLGERATLEIGNVSSSGITVSTSGSGKHAGAIVGEMGEGSTLKLPYDMASFPVTSVTASGNDSYAGGIAGYNKGGTITYTTPDEGASDETTYTVDQTISGKAGSGGIFGYYEPALTSGAATLNYDDINVNCSVNGTGSSGGLFGVLCNNNGSITMTDSTGDADHIKVDNTKDSIANFGGLIGYYSASSLSNTLTIDSGCTSKPSQSGKSTNYGGAIGAVASASYVRLNGFSTTAAGAANFGGAVGNADGAFIDVNGLTVSANEFTGGGVVNALGNGVLRMQGTIDLSGAKSKSGQIVNTRNAGFVFAEAGWVLKRSTSAAGVDDIASWGEVVRFQSSGLTKASVLTHSDGDHYVTLLDAVTTMSSASDFARTALNIQHNNNTITDTSAVLRFTTPNTSSTLLSSNLSLGSSFSLTGTGIQGLTRDDDTQSYSAIFNGGGNTLTLTIGENYGERSGSAVAADAAGCGKIYKHTNVGLFGKVNDATIKNVTLAGNIYVCSAATQSVGAAAAENAGGFTAYGVTVNTAMHHSGSSQLLMGGLLGKSTSGNITIGGSGNIENLTVPKACSINANITGSNSGASTCIGGAVGYIGTGNFTAAITKVTVKGTIEDTSEKAKQQLGGLVAYIVEGSGARSLTVNDVTIYDLSITGNVSNGGSLGGFLGYAWYDTNVTLGNTAAVTVQQITTDKTLLTAGTASNVDMAGLVYAGTGQWTIGTVAVPYIKTSAKSVRSFGMIVNKGWHNTGDGAAIYLVLPNMLTYTLGASGTPLSKISNFSGFTDTTVFDELVAYSAFYDEEDGERTSKVLENGQGIVSIRTRGAKNANNEDTNNTSIVNNVMKQNTCNTYQNQVTGVNMGNPNTRYYYDLDLLLAKASANLNSADKLMLWSLNKYAHSSLTGTGKPFANNPFSNNAIAPSTGQTFDMDGYSYYPVDVSGATIKGTFKLYNKEIEDGESASVSPTDSYVRTTLNQTGSPFTTTPYTQHHLMQNGIFLNANDAIVINGVLTLQGTIGADTYSNTGSGALICGMLQGYLDSNGNPVNASLMSEDIKDDNGDVTTDCEIVLDGIKVHNIGNRESTVYAPLLVNRIDSYSEVSLEDVYVKNSSSYGTTDVVAASSLIGDAGTSTESCNINLTFHEIKLDGRKESIPETAGNAALTEAYGTSLSIFTKATLLNKYQYYTGSSGKYTYKLSEDWGTDNTGNRFVTYGKEVGYDNSTENSEWGNKEQRYLAEAGSTDNPYYTHPDGKPTSSSTKYGSFDNFLPYVATAYDGNTKHELKVNHGKTTITGCGTYNDPYLITDGQQLADIATIISGNHDSAIVCMPNDTADFTAKWHGSGGHQNYIYNNGTYSRADNQKTNIATDNIVQYLCSAYYKINEDIELPADFVGLGCNGTSNQAFRGVIVGNNKPTITNLSPNPLILNSNGSVVKDVTIKVSNSGITTVDVASASTTFGVNKNLEAYGAVIGKIHGGDNIIDNVGVTFDTGTTISVAGKRTPVGGYVGVETAGALIFRNMTTNKNGLTSAVCNLVSDDNYLYVNPIIGRVINAYAVTETAGYHPFEDTTRTGYSAANAVTMKNGTKNYSITDIVKESTTNGQTTSYPMLQIGAYNAVSGASSTTNKTTVTFPNAQSVFILSCLIQDGLTSNSSATYGNGNTNIKSYNDNNYKTTHVSQYRGIGLMAKVNGEDTIITDKAAYGTANATAKADYDLAITDSYVVVNPTAKNNQVTSKTITPYLVKNYVDSTNQNIIYCLTNTGTVCDIGFTGTAGTWYLPDGFRGLGSVAFGSNENQSKQMTLSVNKVSGLIGSNVVNLDLNMNLKHYDYSFDNYRPYGNGGFGLFNTIRHNRVDQLPSGVTIPTNLEERTNDDYKIMYLDISGKINYDVVHNSGNMEYTRFNVLGITSGTSVGTNYLHTGGLAGYSGFASNENLNVEHIGIDGLEVNGFKTSGGIFGYLKMADSSDHLATISNINTDDLTVTTKLYAGGIVGFVEQIGITIDGVTITDPDIRTYFIGNDYENGTAGIVGCVKNTANNRPITVSNVTIGSLTATVNSMIGRDPSVPLYKTNAAYNRIAAAGVVGESNTNSSTYYSSLSSNEKYSLILNRCHVYNVNFYGNRVAGILAHDGNGESNRSNSTIKISNVEVKSNLNSVIEGLTSVNNHKNRGCGGIAGYIKISTNKYAHFDHCTVDGYSFISYNDTAGLCANLQDQGSAKVQNVRLSNLKFESSYNGGLFAYLKVATTGYNIQMNNLQFKKYSSQNYIDDSLGYLIGKNAGVNVSISGFSRQIPEAITDGYSVPERMTGTNKNTNSEYYYGTSGYVIFADYKGASSTEQENDWSVHSYNLPTADEDTGEITDIAKKKLNEFNTFSPVYKAVNNESPNVAISSQDYVILPKTVEVNGVTRFITDKDGNTITYKDYYNIAQNFPFVTSSPFMNIGVQSVDSTNENRKHMQFLTGDGVSSLDYEHSAANKILDDLQLSTKPKNYYNKVTLNAEDLDSLLTEKSSTFQTVMSTQYPADLKTLGINFPVLIVDNTNGSYLDTFLNGYLQTLTNTNYIFSANDQSSIYNLRIAKCEYNSENKNFDVTYKSNLNDTPAADGVSLYTKNGNFTFDINHVDSGKVQFTLIDVEFYNPGTTAEVAYHLYVPLYVSQMLKFDFQVSSKSGSNYKLSEYTSDRGNSTLENAGTPITIEARYVYQRDESEWQQAAENGESLLRSIPKTWSISDQANHHGFPKDTKMVLIDPNNGNKAYYSSVTGGQVYGSGSDVVTDQTAPGGIVSKLYLNRFVDLTGNETFTSTQLNDYFDITLATSNATDGKFIACSNQTNHTDATVCGIYNGTKIWLKPKTDETSGSFYNISTMTYKSTAPTIVNGSKTYLKEDYYVTIFTKNDGNLYHWNIVAPNDLGESQYPSLYSRLDNQRTQQSTQIVTGDLFVITDDALTTEIYEGSNGSYVAKNANDVDIASRITVDVTNKIGMTEQMFKNKSFLGNSSVHIFQTFLLSMNKQTGIDESSRGIEAKPAVEMNEYTVGSYNVLTDTANSYYSRYQSTIPRYDSNYIYLENGKDLRQMLYNSNSSVSDFEDAIGITIHANLYLTYSNTGDIGNQYPQREEAQLNDNTIGTWIGCNSSIASTEAAAIASKTTEYIAESSNTRNLYYSSSSSTASLLYSSDDFDGKYSGGNLYDQLGINAKDLPSTVTNNLCYMNTVAVYDVSKLMSIIDDSDGVELTFRLVRKDANGKYTQDLDIADYLTPPTFKTLTVTSDTSSNSKIYTYRFAKADLTSVYNGGVYTIPIDFTVKTNFSGADLADHYYSNYKVIVSASLYEMQEIEVDGTTETKPVQMSGTNADDHIIYTNAKIDADAFD